MPLPQTRVILLSSLFLTLFYNLSFFKAVLNVYPFSTANIGFLISLFIALFSFIFLFLSLLSSKYSTKFFIILLFFLSSFTAYFMDSYHIVIDDTMIENTLETSLKESVDLFSLKLCLYVIFLGIIPAFIIFKLKITYFSLQKELVFKLKSLITIILITTLLFFSFSKAYLSFVREHKPIRYYINPLYSLFSAGKYLGQLSKSQQMAFKKIGNDAQIPLMDDDRELIILVIGETARADRFSVNGYHRETNPLLKKEAIINLPHVDSCGTSTAVSVPCIFSISNRENYEKERSLKTENILDVLKRAGVNVLWRDNNSDSKGVALRVEYQDYKSQPTNTLCDTECRDSGMLVGLQTYIDTKKEGDILIVLHQMGSHGPAYYKRYPKAFEKFKPVCKTNQLEQCSQEEINNAYDNTILYTDYFLSNVITILKNNNQQFETAMLYISDHGESLGEKGLYLHGMPYMFAPKEQTQVAAILWFGEQFKINRLGLKNQVKTKQYSHDNIFHTLLGLMEIKTTLYNPNLDIVDTFYDEHE